MISFIKENFILERNRWVLWMPVLFGLGIAIYFALPVEPSKWIILGIIEILLVLAFFFRRNRIALAWLGIFCIIVLGFANIQLRTIFLDHNMVKVEAGRVYLTGRIEEVGKNYRGKTRIVLADMKNFDNEDIIGKYRLTLTSPNNNLQIGDCVEMVAEVSPLLKTSIVGGYQSDRNLFYDGISGMGYVPSRVLPLECSYKFYFSEYSTELRKAISDEIVKEMPPSEAAVAVAIVAGNQDLMNKNLISAYRDSGLAHFLSISGLHMSMIAGLMFFFVRFVMAMIPPLALRYNNKKIAAILSILVAVIYLVISGAAIPAQRAFIMTFVVLLAVILERQAISMRTLAVAALLVLVVSPEAIVSASFQMSFAAVVALIAFYEKFAARISRFMQKPQASILLKSLRIIWVYVLGILLADLVASLATMPFAIYHFNRVALYTTLTNMAAGPIIGLMIMPFVLLSLIVMPLGLEFITLKPVSWGLGWVNDLTSWVASLPNAAIEVYSPPVWGFSCIVIGGLWLCLWQRKWRHLGWIGVVLGIFSVFTITMPDLVVDRDIKTVAVKNADGKLEVLKGARGWNKDMWLSKYASTSTANKNRARKYKEPQNSLYPNRVNVIKKQAVIVEGKDFDIKSTQGASFYDDNGKIKVRTVRNYIGNRPWNR